MNAALESSVDFGAEDNARLAAVCGPLDENLHLIENRLGIEIRRRSGRFSLRGANAAMGAAVLRQLYERALGQPVTPEDVHLALQESGMGARPAADEHAVETLRGLIRGRGANQQKYLEAIRSHDLTFGIGPAGTGKTYLAVACAVEAMQREACGASCSCGRRWRRASGSASCRATCRRKWIHTSGPCTTRCTK